jgi:predicted NUDIX family NTP pyrophosphohydrolase
MFRQNGQAVEFLLVHPGGPFFARKDEGSWTIPKGEAEPREELLHRAKIEFAEELGFRPEGDFQSLGSIRQKGGKVVYAWAFAGKFPVNFVLSSNRFELEWPPRSGKFKSFPEIDHAEFFPQEIAREKINPAQVELITRTLALLS